MPNTNTNNKAKVSIIKQYNKNTANKVINLVKDNPNDWQQLVANNQMFNVSKSPTAYQGVNAISLAKTNADRGNTDNRFMTRNQAEKAGMGIKDNAKAMQISYLSPQSREDANGKKVSALMMRVGYVYNAKDISGIEKAADVEQKVLTKTQSAAITKEAITKATAAVKENYTNDSKDIQNFKIGMASALLVQKQGADFVSSKKPLEINTDFLKDAKIGMKAIRSSAKIANFITNDKTFEMKNTQVKTDDKTIDKVNTKVKTKTPKKGSAVAELAKNRANENKGRGART